MHWLMDYVPPCVVKFMTGWPCPWCGMQRGIVALLEGELGEALVVFPPLFPMLFLILALGINLKFEFNNRLFLLYGAYALVLASLVFNFITKILAL